MVIPNISAIYTDHGSVPPDPSNVIHYKFFKKLLESQGYTFQKHERPRDIWKDKYGNEIHICETCRILVINGTKIQMAGSRGIAYYLINFLFNTEPNGHKESGQPSS